jgi:hypothetical protein
VRISNNFFSAAVVDENVPHIKECAFISSILLYGTLRRHTDANQWSREKLLTAFGDFSHWQ